MCLRTFTAVWAGTSYVEYVVFTATSMYADVIAGKALCSFMMFHRVIISHVNLRLSDISTFAFPYVAGVTEVSIGIILTW